MIVIVLENAPPGLRGELTKWMLEVKAGTFVGNASAVVRDKLWGKVTGASDAGAALMIYSAQTEQGFAIEMCREPRRSVVDLEGLYFIRTVAEKEGPTGSC